MHEGLRRLYSGEFNFISQDDNNDGTVTVTIRKATEDTSYRFRVRDLYGKNEEVLEHEIIESKVPKFIQDRMEQARKEMGPQEIGGGQ